uniref:recombinase family protein n=1 Tax=Altererythrobacter segetis TaxID=1104773 RepID=UPI00140766F0|nr:recombinase family protein [Altererythrobacter segetis]
MNTRPSVRCAIYTRKSTEEGLGQAFNTLDAQREACAAYIRSQAAEGWQETERIYEDGGYSGGTLNRPAIRELLDDVEHGVVDMIVVHRIDRLTRSLADFMRIVERLDAAGASFVSVTQSFNTATSVGRLMLNVLLSFAQFERELTGERIREKVAASKAKGIWMGGCPPLGYDVCERGLSVNDEEATNVRYCFERYAKLRSGLAVIAELRSRGMMSKQWISRSGRPHGGKPFLLSNLYYLLENRIYVGEIVHRGQVYPGQHEAIVDRALFERVQTSLEGNRRRRRTRPTRESHCKLMGLVHDGMGAPMGCTFSYGRGGRLYCYYVSGSLLRGEPRPAGKFVGRVPAAPLEQLVAARVRRLVGERQALEWSAILALLKAVQLHEGSIQLVFRPDALLDPHEAPEAACSRLAVNVPEDRLIVDEARHLRLVCDRGPRLRGGSTWSFPQVAGTQARKRSRNSIVAAHRLLERYNLSPLSPEAHPHASAPREKNQRRLMILGLLAPSIQRELLAGEAVVTREQLLSGEIPLAWKDQIEMLAGLRLGAT